MKYSAIVLAILTLSYSVYAQEKEIPLWEKGAPGAKGQKPEDIPCLLYTSPSPRDRTRSRMPSSA